LFSKNKNKDLIIHPELGGEKINSDLTNLKNKIDKEFSENEESNFTEDSTLNFISLDKNGIPQIKKNFYDALGVKPNSPPKEIKINFLKIARKYHPDKHPESLVNKILIYRLFKIYYP
jgi:hypothetical protein